jgi:hypothetical protein
MPYEFESDPPEPETQPDSRRGRKPPDQGVATPDFGPLEPSADPANLPNVSVTTWLAILVVLIAIGAVIFLYYIPR